jgi:hypothetical protein
MLPDHMTSVVHPNQVHSAVVDWSIPIAVTPDVVSSSSSSSSEAVACCMPTTVWDTHRRELATYKRVNGHTRVPQRFPANKALGRWVITQRVNRIPAIRYLVVFFTSKKHALIFILKFKKK